MIFGLLRKREPEPPDAAETAYAAIVAAARRPAFYASLGVPDTLPGRFELIVLHVALYLRRLRADGRDGAAFGQRTFDAMVRALDANLREIGIGDMSLPKRMKAMARSFYDGAAAYDAALDEDGDARLETELIRIVYAGTPAGGAGPRLLASYARRADFALADQDFATLTAEGPVFPAVEETR